MTAPIPATLGRRSAPARVDDLLIALEEDTQA
jgi:hypothetical protein